MLYYCDIFKSNTPGQFLATCLIKFLHLDFALKRLTKMQAVFFLPYLPSTSLIPSHGASHLLRLDSTTGYNVSILHLLYHHSLCLSVMHKSAVCLWSMASLPTPRDHWISLGWWRTLKLLRQDQSLSFRLQHTHQPVWPGTSPITIRKAIGWTSPAFRLICLQRPLWSAKYSVVRSSSLPPFTLNPRF